MYYELFFSKARRISRYSLLLSRDIFDEIFSKKTDGSEKKSGQQLSFTSLFNHSLVSRFPNESASLQRQTEHTHSFFPIICALWYGEREREREREREERAFDSKDKEASGRKPWEVGSRIYSSWALSFTFTLTSHENSVWISSWEKRASFFHYRCFLRAFWSSNDRSQWYIREVYQKRWRWRRQNVISTWIFQWDWQKSIRQRTGNRIRRITQSSRRSISSSLARTIAARIS